MPECRNCGASLDSSFRFCPMCMTPQTDKAKKRLRQYVQQRAGKSGGNAASDSLQRRIRYAVGYVAIVAGLATLLDIAGVFFLLAGVAVLPPIQRVIEAQLDQSIGLKPTVGAAGALSVLGALVLVFV